MWGFINNLLCMHDGADPAGGEPIHYVVGGGLIQPAVSVLVKPVVG